MPRMNYGILGGPVDGSRRISQQYSNVEAVVGRVFLHRGSGFRGAVVRIEHDGGLVLRSKASSAERVFSMAPGAFAYQGETVNVVRPKAPDIPAARTASGSIASALRRARVARSSRILVEGVHDAELVEKVWGDDLRQEGIVVERLDGIDHLTGYVAQFRPDTSARLGVLVDHLVPSSKESRIARDVTSRYVMVTGTPFVDIWQAIRPQAAGIDAWPTIPMGTDWKSGMCEFFGVAESGVLWKQLLGRVNSFADLERPLVGAVESMIDFLTDECL